MKRGLTGRYETTAIGGETIRAFVPAPLPPDPPLEMTPERLKLLEKAMSALGRLDSITLLLPEPELFLYSYVRREAVLYVKEKGRITNQEYQTMFSISRQTASRDFSDLIKKEIFIVKGTGKRNLFYKLKGKNEAKDSQMRQK